MTDTRISAATDATTLVDSDKFPIARSASTTALYGTMAEVGAYIGVTYASQASVAAAVSAETSRATTAEALLAPMSALSAYLTTAAAASTYQAALGFTPYNATNPSGYQTAAQVATAISSVVGAAPAALDTLLEIANQLSTDESAVGALTATVALKAPLASPTLTGTPAAPTPAVDTNTTQLATTAMVLGQAASAAPLPDGVAAAGISTRYARADHVHASVPDIGRNLIHNGLFRVQQRGAGPWTTGIPTQTADRWLQTLSTSTLSTTLVALADADRTAIGDETATAALQCVVGGTAGAGDYAAVQQHIESVQRLAGKTVTVSFWAKATSGTPKIGYALAQNFGTGGSPSAGVSSIGSAATAALSTTWTRYTSAPIAVPTSIGKTFGSTASTDYTALELWLTSGATLNSRAGGIGVQSGTIQLWGVQLEIGSVATPLEKPDLRYELANCQRFYLAKTALLVSGYAATAGSIYADHAFPVTMRANPTIVLSGAAYSNASALNLAAAAPPDHARIIATVTATGSAYATFDMTASADL